MKKNSPVKKTKQTQQTDASDHPTSFAIDHDYHKGVSPDDFKHSYINNLKYRLVKEEETATNYDRFLSLAYGIRDRLVENWVSTQRVYRSQKVKRVYYFSLEFLIGRTLGNSILNLRIEKNLLKAMDEFGLKLEEVRDAELDAGLGNGGLGRLAACFLDSLATLEIPAYGYGIRYDYGIFRQKIVRGYQVEEPDEWLAKEHPWEISRPEYTYRVRFGERWFNGPPGMENWYLTGWTQRMCWPRLMTPRFRAMEIRRSTT